MKKATLLKWTVFAMIGLLNYFLSAGQPTIAAPGLSHRDCGNCHQGQAAGAPSVVAVFKETSHSTEITITSPPAYNIMSARCQRCHDVDSAAEKLLKKPFSELCVTCHENKMTALGSRHDVSYASAAPQKGACLNCHTPHPESTESPGFDSLWTRSLTSETVLFRQGDDPNYVRGKTILCYDCHSAREADDDPGMSSFESSRTPQDIAFSGDGEAATGAIGYYETDPATDTPPSASRIASGAITGGHYIKSPGTTGISRGDKLPCGTCHEPHNVNQNNEAFIREPLGGRQAGNLKASVNTRNGSGSGREICTTCHGYGQPGESSYTPSVTFNNIDQTWGSSDTIVFRPTTVADHGPSSSTPCTSCHAHNRISQNCASCHGYPPKSAGLDDSGNRGYGGGIGAHTVHVEENKLACTECHPSNGSGSTHGGTVGRLAVTRDNVNVEFDSLRVFPGGTSVDNGSEATQSYDATAGFQCYVGCHNPIPFYPGNIEPTLTNRAVWNDGSSTPGVDVSCAYCHAPQGAAMVEGTVAGARYVSAHNIDTQTRSDCEACHDTGKHRQGEVRLKSNDDTSIIVWDASDTDALEPFCLSCHDSDGNQPFSQPSVPRNIETSWTEAAHNTGGGNPDKRVSCFGDGKSGCHGNPHGSAKKRLLGPSNIEPSYSTSRGAEDEEGFCFSCHDDPANSAAGINILERFYANSNDKSHHNIRSAEQAATGAKVECTDCHNTHRNNALYKNIDPDSPYDNWQTEINDVTLEGTAAIQPLATGIDTYVDGRFPSASYGAKSTMWVGRIGGLTGAPSRGLIKFDLSRLPDDAIVASATLSLPQTGTGAAAAAQQISVHQNYFDFGETTATYINAPLFNESAAATASSPLSYGYLNFSGPEFTTLVSNWISGALPNNGVTIRAAADGTASASNIYREFYTSDQPRRTPPGTTVSEQPRLLIAYSSSKIPRTRDFVGFCGKCHDGDPPPGVVFPATTRQIQPNFDNPSGGDTHGANPGPRIAANSVNGAVNGPYFFGIGKLPCADCHDPHGSSNAYHLKETINGQSGLVVPMSITSSNFGQVQKWCGACHSVTHAPNANCFSCHFHGANVDANNETHF